MTIRNRFATGGVALALALTGVGAATVGSTWAVAAEAGTDPAATTEDGSTTSDDTSFVERITSALAGLVGDGTITQDQADSVAETLASSDAMRGGPHGGGHGGHHGPGMGGPGGLDVAAQTLGVAEDELHTALEGGSTLAEVAQENGVAVDTLVDALVAAGQERLAEAVTDGRLTQEQADELAAGLPDRVAQQVEEVWEPRGQGRGGRDGLDGPGQTLQPDGADGTDGTDGAASTSGA